LKKASIHFIASGMDYNIVEENPGRKACVWAKKIEIRQKMHFFMGIRDFQI